MRRVISTKKYKLLDAVIRAKNPMGQSIHGEKLRDKKLG